MRQFTGLLIYQNERFGGTYVIVRTLCTLELQPADSKIILWCSKVVETMWSVPLVIVMMGATRYNNIKGKSHVTSYADSYLQQQKNWGIPHSAEVFIWIKTSLSSKEESYMKGNKAADEPVPPNTANLSLSVSQLVNSNAAPGLLESQPFRSNNIMLQPKVRTPLHS